MGVEGVTLTNFCLKEYLKFMGVEVVTLTNFCLKEYLKNMGVEGPGSYIDKLLFEGVFEVHGSRGSYID